MKIIPKDFVAASATPLILSILDQEDSYGYEIIKRVRELSGGALEWSDGMLYPILHRLERKKYIESYSRAVQGRRRKYYKILPLGQSELIAQRQTWSQLNSMLNALKCAT